jgi:hypothetical protein
MKLQQISTDEKIVDILTKPLVNGNFFYWEWWRIPPLLRGVLILYLQEVFPQEAKVSGMWESSLAQNYPFVSVKSTLE